MAALVLVAAVVVVTHHSSSSSVRASAPLPPPLGAASSATPSTTGSTVASTIAPGISVPPRCSPASSIVAATPNAAAANMVADADAFRFPTGGLGIYGALTPDNNEALPTSADAAGWFTADTRDQLAEAMSGLGYVSGDRAEWSAGPAALHVIVYQFDTPAHAVTFVQDYMVASCSYLSDLHALSASADGVSFVSMTASEPQGRVMMVVGSDMVSLSTCGCESQMQAAAEGWAASVNTTYAVAGQP